MSRHDTITLKHRNGETKEVAVSTVVFAKTLQGSRSFLSVRWAPLAGEYAVDLHSGKLYAYGKGGGLRREPLDWEAADREQMLRIAKEMGRVRR